MEEFVILVDENDNEIGIEEKMKAHEDAKLHRAFSIFIFNSKGEMLLQQRACDKYHSGCLWTNATCSHPRPGEKVEQAAHRRLQEEMGFDTDLKKEFHFIYKAKFDHGLTEHELDHVFIGQYDGPINLNSDEADDYKWIDLATLQKDMKENPNDYTVWFKIAFKKVLNLVMTSHIKYTI
jgi:isopentenyl-diphosphate delta-isomerase